MGFRAGSYARIWSSEPVSDGVTKINLSISKKNKTTEKYETEFSGFVKFIGTVNAKYAAKLKDGDRIKLGDVDVKTFKGKTNGKYYTEFICFNFDVVENQNNSQENNPFVGSVLPDSEAEFTNEDAEDNKLPF